MRGTEDAIARLESAICTAFARGKSLYAVFFDIREAYDTAWKFGILKFLHEFGVRGQLGIFVKNFLDERTFKVKVGNYLSDTFRQEQGVPQGSVLICTLFLIAMNKATDDLPTGVQATLYVDDLAI